MAVASASSLAVSVWLSREKAVSSATARRAPSAPRACPASPGPSPPLTPNSARCDASRTAITELSLSDIKHSCGGLPACDGMTGETDREDRRLLPHHAARLLRPLFRAPRIGPCSEPAQAGGEHPLP